MAFAESSSRAATAKSAVVGPVLPSTGPPAPAPPSSAGGLRQVEVASDLRIGVFLVEHEPHGAGLELVGEAPPRAPRCSRRHRLWSMWAIVSAFTTWSKQTPITASTEALRTGATTLYRC
jgi:hypothetical protein